MGQEFVMLVGLPASGKSTFGEKMEREGYAWFSSDLIRAELYGSPECQTNPNLVFDLMLKRTKKALAEGKSVIYDATNLISKKRKAVVSALSKFSCNKVALVIATPYDICLKRNNARTRKVPRTVIERMYKSFQIPTKAEGWDDVDYFYPQDDLDFMQKIEPYYNSLDECVHDNPHHSRNVKEHMEACYEYFKQNYPLEATIDWLAAAIKYHDIGKWFCKTYTNTKGEKTDVAHFYGHENVGAYQSLFIHFDTYDDPKVSELIQWHMRPHEWDKNPKLKEKDSKCFDPAFIRALEIIHDCDINNN